MSTQKTATKPVILAALRAWVNQRPGLQYCNYGDPTSYRAEQRGIARDKADAQRLLTAVEYSDITAAALRDAFPRFYSGRLTWKEDGAGGGVLKYCCGQYWPTEYRKAACAVLSGALWNHERDTMPADIEKPGDYIRACFKGRFGRKLASRWFD